MASFKNLSLYIQKLIKENDNHFSFSKSSLKLFLLLLSFPYQLIVQQRNRIYDNKWLKQKKCPIPIISIGNIVAGGTGKTPLTITLVKALTELNPNIKIAILTRGYRSKAEKYSHPVVLHSQNLDQFTPEICGDEPYLLAQKLPKCHVIIHPKRFLSAQVALKLGIDVVILDDGMQHRQLARNCEIVVMDAENLFGYNHCLPRGLLREPLKNLSRANLVFINHCNNSVHLNECKEQLKQFTNVPIIGFRPKPLNLHLWSQSKNQSSDCSLESFKQTRAGIFCGIGKPEGFQKLVQKLEIDVVSSLIFADHCFELDQLKEFALRCKALGATHLICTEKDFVKLKSFAAEADFVLPILWLEIGLELIDSESQSLWLKALNHLHTPFF